MGCTSSSPPPPPQRVTTVSQPPKPKVVAGFRQKYRTGDVLGDGAYSVVKRCYNKESDEEFAVKICTKASLSHQEQVALLEEVKIMKSLQHPNCVRLYDFYEEPDYYYLVLEIVAGGELFDRIVEKTSYSEREARDVVRIMVNAIKYMHDLGIVHRDLKPENLLLASKTNDYELKVADFGFAARCSGHDSLTEQCGTPGYIAPEILEGVPYGLQADMWSIGVITYILLGGYPPFNDDNEAVMNRKIKKGEYSFHPEFWGNVSEDAKDLIRKMLTVDPKQRYTADQVLHHKWITASSAELAAYNLDSNLAEFKRYQQTRQFRSAVKTIIAIMRMKALIGESADEGRPAEESK